MSFDKSPGVPAVNVDICESVENINRHWKAYLVDCLSKLTSDQRLEVFADWCKICGDPKRDGRCVCYCDE